MLGMVVIKECSFNNSWNDQLRNCNFSTCNFLVVVCTLGGNFSYNVTLNGAIKLVALDYSGLYFKNINCPYLAMSLPFTESNRALK